MGLQTGSNDPGALKQLQIIRSLDVRPQIDDSQSEVNRIVCFLSNYLQNHAKSAEALVLGISGGQDSTLTGKLCRLATDQVNSLPEDHLNSRRVKFIAVRLPYGEQADEEDCQSALTYICPDLTYTVNIKPAVDASCESLRTAGIQITDFVKGNEKARERMKVQYSIAAHHRGLVVGTDHAAEAVSGFYTKYGDGGTDINPLHGLTKRMGRQLLKHLQCPPQLYCKQPTADLEDNRPGLPDEAALGVTYDQIDDFLEGKPVPREAQERIVLLYDRSAHKRAMPVTPACLSQ